MSKIRVNKFPKANKEYLEKVLARRNPYLHHIHVMFGDQVFTVSHDEGFITCDQLYAVLNDIRSNFHD